MTQFNHGKTIDSKYVQSFSLENRLKGKRTNPLIPVMLGSLIGTMGIMAYKRHENEMAIYDKVNSAPKIETSYPAEARPWDYCRNENPRNTPKGDAFYDACLQRLYAENPGLKEGKHFTTINAIDIDGDDKVSSKH